MLRAGALGRPRGIGWRGRWEGGSGWGIHVNPWLIHVNVWQKPLQYCKVISLQLIKINEKKEWGSLMWVSWTEVDEPRTCYTEWSKSEREQQISYINAHICNVEKWYMNLFARQAQNIEKWCMNLFTRQAETHRGREQTHGHSRGKVSMGWNERVALKYTQHHA